MITDVDAKSQITRAIEGTGVATSDEYDLDAILREAFEFTMPHGFVQTVDDIGFWEVVARNEKAPA